MGKVAEFINEHGYTYKSFVLATIIFPPAGIVIAWKRPDTHLVIRLALTVVATLPMVIVPLGGVALLQNLIS